MTIQKSMNLTAGALKANTFIDVLTARADQTPANIAYTFLLDGETQAVSVSYQALDQQARAIATHLQHFNVQGSCVLLLYRPSLEFIAGFFGCLYAGAIAVPINPPRRIEKISTLAAILKATQAPLALTTSTLLPNLKARLTSNGSQPQVHWVATDTLDLSQTDGWQPAVHGQDHLALLQYTSGSTGIPKGVMITHENLWQNAQLLAKPSNYHEHTLNVSWLPPFHDMGLMGNILQPMYVGKPSVLMKPIAFIQKPIRWLQAISHYRATHSGGPNFAYDLLCRYITPAQRTALDLSCWETAFCGAEPIRAETLDRFSKTFAACGFRQAAFYPCYGMAEATLFISGGDPAQPPTLLNLAAQALEQNRVIPAQASPSMARTVVGCGHPWLDTRIEIVDPQTLQRCSSTEIGEIWVMGSGVAKGYWHQPAETAQTFHAHLSDTGEGPFLRTGDLGFIYNQELFITGRLKEMLICWGLNRYPQHIEQTIEKSHPAFRQNGSAAFTVNVAGEERLVIVVEIERRYRQQLPVDAMVESVRWRIAREQFLDVYAIAFLPPGQLPLTSSGKIQRRLCRTKFLAGDFVPLAQWQDPLDSQSDLRRLFKRYINPVTHLKRYLAILHSRIL